MTRLACEENPDDWFLGRDGRQYVDDELLTDSERRSISRSVLWQEGESEAGHRQRVRLALEAGERERRRRGIVRRRAARDACMECPIQVQCLELALYLDVSHGTWGGYYEEQIRRMKEAQDG